MTDTDRELLELAAKAVGGTLSEGDTRQRTGETWDQWEWTGGLGISMPDGLTISPLTNDGDAFRLQVALHFTVRCYMGSACVQSTVPGGPSVYIEETDHANPCAATRRAITRAAAEIGRAA